MSVYVVKEGWAYVRRRDGRLDTSWFGAAFPADAADGELDRLRAAGAVGTVEELLALPDSTLAQLAPARLRELRNIAARTS